MSFVNSNKRKLSISSDGQTKSRKLSLDSEGVNGVTILEHIIIPPTAPCNFQRTQQLIRSLAADFTQLGHHMKGIIDLEKLKIEANRKELSEMRKLYNAMKIKEAENKRKRWCRWCCSEASFVNTEYNSFYCSLECEELDLNALKKFNGVAG